MAYLKTLSDLASFKTIDTVLTESADRFTLNLDLIGSISNVRSSDNVLFKISNVIDIDFLDIYTKDINGNVEENRIVNVVSYGGNGFDKNNVDAESSLTMTTEEFAVNYDAVGYTSVVLPDKYVKSVFRIKDKFFALLGYGGNYIIELKENGGVGAMHKFKTTSDRGMGFSTSEHVYQIYGLKLWRIPNEYIVANLDLLGVTEYYDLDITNTSIATTSPRLMGMFEGDDYVYYVFYHYKILVRALKTTPHILMDVPNITFASDSYEKRVWCRGNEIFVFSEYTYLMQKITIDGDNLTLTTAFSVSKYSDIMVSGAKIMLLSDGFYNPYNGYHFSFDGVQTRRNLASPTATYRFYCLAKGVFWYLMNDNGSYATAYFKPNFVNENLFESASEFNLEDTPTNEIKEIGFRYDVNAKVAGNLMTMDSLDINGNNNTTIMKFSASLETPIDTINHEVEIGKKDIFLKSSQLNAFKSEGE